MRPDRLRNGCRGGPFRRRTRVLLLCADCFQAAAAVEGRARRLPAMAFCHGPVFACHEVGTSRKTRWIDRRRRLHLWRSVACGHILPVLPGPTRPGRDSLPEKRIATGQKTPSLCRACIRKIRKCTHDIQLEVLQACISLLLGGQSPSGHATAPTAGGHAARPFGCQEPAK